MTARPVTLYTDGMLSCLRWIIVGVFFGVIASANDSAPPSGRREQRPSQSSTVRRKPAQENTAKWVKGKIVADKATVYQSPDFDGKVLGMASKGRIFYMVSTPTGAFHKIQVRSNVYGYVSDVEIRSTERSNAANPAEKSKKKNAKAEKKKKPFDETAYRGLSMAMVNFREDTMGMRPTESMFFFGLKLAGPDMFIEGTGGELNVWVSPSAPKYYEQATGNSAGGFILLIDGLISHASTSSKNTMTFYGFGPMMKFSKFNTVLTVAGKNEQYAMDNINVGVALNFGMAQRLGDFALRAEAKYYWEQMQYLGFAVSGQMEF